MVPPVPAELTHLICTFALTCFSFHLFGFCKFEVSHRGRHCEKNLDRHTRIRTQKCALSTSRFIRKSLMIMKRIETKQYIAEMLTKRKYRGCFFLSLYGRYFEGKTKKNTQLENLCGSLSRL